MRIMEERIFVFMFSLKTESRNSPPVNRDPKNIHIYNSKKSKTAIVPMTSNISVFIQLKKVFLNSY